MISHRYLFTCILVAAAAPLAAQGDSVGRVYLNVHGTSDAQPGLIVVAGPGLDSVRTIVQRDLDYSNRSFVPRIPDSVGTLRGPLNPANYKPTGALWLVELEPAFNGVDVKLYDVPSGALRQQATRAAVLTGVGDSRLTIHQISDLIVGWTGGIGIAATRIAFVMALKETWRVDADGANMVRISRPDTQTMTPAWSPDGSMVAYSIYSDAQWKVYLQKIATGTRSLVPSESPGNDYGAAFSPDNKSLAFTHNGAKGADIEVADIVHLCCAFKLTSNGALADNLSPTYSPDGHRIGFMSKRTGTPDLYVMDDDGTNPRQLVVGGSDGGASYRPAWAPDGAKVAFGRDTQASGGGRQLFYALITSGAVVQLTSTGTNEDPSWAPDSRHLIFKSRRTGREQLWILDVESRMTRQLPTPGIAQFPAWSRALGPNP